MRKVPLAEAKRETQPGNGTALRSRFKLTRWVDVHFDAAKEDWLVHGLLPGEGVAVLYGKWKSFKSFVALDLAVAIAAHRKDNWAGGKTKQGVVVYIAGEGQGGMHKRIEAYKRSQPALGDLDFYIIKARPNLGGRPGDVAELVKAIREALDDDDPVLVIVDTLSRTLAGNATSPTTPRTSPPSSAASCSRFTTRAQPTTDGCAAARCSTPPRWRRGTSSGRATA
jgi:hypothetical protein